MAQTATHSAPSPAPILELIHAFRKSSILFVGIRIGLFDVVHMCAQEDPSGTVALDTIVRHLGAGAPTPLVADASSYSKPFSSDAVDRFLRASASLGLILVHSENEVTRFSLTDVSTAYLLTNAPTSLAGYIHHSDVTIVPLFLALPYSLETGDSAWPAAFPRRSEGTYRLSHLSTTPESRVSSTSALPSTNQGPSPLPGSSASNNTTLGSFDSLYATPLSRDRFLRAMHAHATLSATLLASAFDLSWAHRAVDLGGASGALALALKEKWGESGLVEVCVVDLPSVVEDSVRIWEWFRDGRVRAVPGDFLADDEGAALLPKGDLIVLSRILHDWDDTTCVKILKRASSLLEPVPQEDSQGNPVGPGRTGILIAETLLDGPERIGPVSACLQDINMLVQTGGRERTLEQFTALLRVSGFNGEIRAVRTGGYLDAILAFREMN